MARTAKTLGKLFDINRKGIVDTKVEYLNERMECKQAKFTKKVIIKEHISKILFQLMMEVSTEWMIYLGGKKVVSKKGNKSKETEIIDRYYFPLQQVQQAYVEPIGKNREAHSYTDEFRKTSKSDVVYTLHSHNSMGAFASGTDKDNILITGDGGFILSKQEGFSYKFYRKVKLPCGVFALVDATKNVNFEAIDIQETEYSVVKATGKIGLKFIPKFADLEKAGIDKGKMKKPKPVNPAFSGKSYDKYPYTSYPYDNLDQFGSHNYQRRQLELINNKEKHGQYVVELENTKDDGSNNACDEGYSDAEEWLEKGAVSWEKPSYMSNDATLTFETINKRRGFRDAVKDMEDATNMKIDDEPED